MSRRARVVLALIVVTAAHTDAQQVRGVVRDSLSGQAIPGAVVMLLDSAGATLERTIGAGDGTFRLARPDAAARLRVIRIGFQPRVVSIGRQDDASAPIVVSMSRIPPRLTQVRVEGTSVCPGADRATDALQLWEQARAGLLAAVVAREANPARTSLLRYTRDLAPARELVTRQDARILSGNTMRPFATFASPSELARRGYMLSGDDVRVFDAPDADVLLDDSFARTHCFRVVRDDEHTGLLGLAFTPAKSSSGKVDVDGVLWIDNDVSALRRLDFRYTGLSRDEMQAGAGGSLSFHTMSNGVVFIDTWEMHLPLLSYETLLGGGRKVPRRRGIHVDGGFVTSAEWSDGSRFVSPGGAVSGRVSQRGTHGPLRAASVWLAGTNDRATTDSAGEFRMNPIVPGRYRIMVGDTSFAVYAKPRRDEREVDVRAGDTATLALELVSHASVAAQLCSGEALRAGRSVILGHVAAESPRALLVGATWVDEIQISNEVHAATITQGTGRRVVTPDAAGRFVVCGVMPGRAVHLTVSRDSVRIADTVVTARDEPTHVELRPRAATVAAAATSPRGGARPAPQSAATQFDEGGVSIEVQLQAKAAGLVIAPAVGGVEIHGPSSFMGSSQPLYVVDGVPWTGGSGDILAGLNPHDIASIKLLKNPDDIAIYGIRGGNGVIVITTTRPGAKPD